MRTLLHFALNVLHYFCPFSSRRGAENAEKQDLPNIPLRTLRLRAKQNIYYFASLLILLTLPTGMSQESALDEASLTETATQFFLNLAEENGKDVTQKFELTDAMRSWFLEEQTMATIQQVLRPFGGIGEFQKSEIVLHNPTLQSVELFYSGTRRPFKARVTFEGNQVAGIHVFPLATASIFESMSVLHSIIWGVILIPMLIASLFLMSGKGAFLIAGYNTMSKKEQAKYDEKALCRSTGRFLLWIICCLILLAFVSHNAIHNGEAGAIGAIFAVTGMMVVSSFIYIIYANTGGRFLKKGDVEKFVDEESSVEDEKRKESFLYSRSLQWISGILFCVLVFGGIPALIFFGEIEPTVKITESGIKIRDMYGVNIDFSEITDISLVESRDIGLTSRTRGHVTERTLKGLWQSSKYGSVWILMKVNSSPTIRIQRKDKEDVLLNFSDNATTRTVYAEMKTAFGK